MAIIDLFQLKPLLSQKQRLLGLDVGQKTIGLSLSDLGRRIASPLLTLKRTKFTQDVEKLKKLIQENNIGALVIGLPLNMDGSEGSRCQSTRQFAQNILMHVDIPIVFWDERLSTQAVTRTLLDADLSREKRADVVDKLAAAYILQGALDSLQRVS